jgi:hypothetical protein
MQSHHLPNASGKGRFVCAKNRPIFLPQAIAGFSMKKYRKHANKLIIPK